MGQCVSSGNFGSYDVEDSGSGRGSASEPPSSSGSTNGSISPKPRPSSQPRPSSGDKDRPPSASVTRVSSAAKTRPASVNAVPTRTPSAGEKERPASVARVPSSSGMIKKTAKDFIFGKTLGEGSFSTVYLAKEVSTQREYAVKVLEKQHMVREKKTQYVMREKDVLGMLGKHKHPFFVSLYCTFQDAYRLYFVLSFEPNGELLQVISRLSVFDPASTKFYSAEIVLALEHLHGLGIIHRDLKPENILLSKDMHIRITDFGSARILGDAKDNNLDEPDLTINHLNPDAGMDLERKSSFVGTAQYVSPEVLTNKKVCKSSDLWALGCIIYQLLSGEHPFGGGHEYMIFQQIVKGKYEFPDGFDPVAQDLVGKLLVVDPDKRLGCEELGGYPPLKEHQFFADTEWDTLHKQDPPKLFPYLPANNTEEENYWSNIPLDMSATGFGDQTLSLALELGLHTGKDEPDTVLSPVSTTPGDIMCEDDRKRALAKQAEENEYHRFVEGNLILKQGFLDKRKGLFARRRMFLLTEGPRLYYVDPTAMVLKGQVPWSRTLRPESKNFKIFFVHTPKRTYYLEDPQGYALRWVKKIDEVWKRYYGPVNPKSNK